MNCHWLTCTLGIGLVMAAVLGFTMAQDRELPRPQPEFGLDQPTTNVRLVAVQAANPQRVLSPEESLRQEYIQLATEHAKTLSMEELQRHVAEIRGTLKKHEAQTALQQAIEELRNVSS